jgi:hypothetical protein
MVSTKEESKCDKGLLTEYGPTMMDEMEMLERFSGLGLEIQPAQLLHPLQQAQPTIAKQPPCTSSVSLPVGRSTSSQSLHSKSEHQAA